MNWHRFFSQMKPWIAYHPTDPKVSVGEHEYNIWTSLGMRNVAEFLDAGLKLKVIKGMMKLPVIGSSRLVDDITKLQKAKAMVEKVLITCHPFSNSWMFYGTRH